MSNPRDSRQYAYVPVFTALIPHEGPLALPMLFDFSTTNSYFLDLQQLLANTPLSAIQAMYVDNSANSSPVTFIWDGSAQSITAPANSQGNYAVLAPDPARVTVVSAGTAKCSVFFLNVPVSSTVWSTSAAGGNQYASGRLLTANPALEGAVVNNRYQTLGSVTGDSGVLFPARIANVAVTGNVTATSGTLVTGNPGYFLGPFNFSLSAGATLGAAGDLVVTLTDSAAGAVYQAVFTLPATASAPAQATQLRHDSPGNWQWNNKAANSTLSLTLSAPLVAGKLYYSLTCGTGSAIG